MDQHALAAEQFGATAQRYLSSTVHAAGADLDWLGDRVGAYRAARVLDLGCGAGHASYAAARGGAGEVVAYDPSQPMLAVVEAEARARLHAQIRTMTGRAETLPFADAAFDVVVTRYSAHHWLDVQCAMREAARVLAPGGRLIVIDVVAPESPLEDTVLQTLELLRDLSHVRDYRSSEWHGLFEQAGLPVTRTELWKLRMEFTGWIARIGTSPARVAALEVVMDALPAEARRYFDVAHDRSFSIDAAWLEAVKPGG